MNKELIKKFYLDNPCMFQPTAFWKLEKMLKQMDLNLKINDFEVIIDNNSILHTYFYVKVKPKIFTNYQLMILNEKFIKDFDLNNYQDEKYFKLIHKLDNLEKVSLNEKYAFRVVQKTELEKVVEIINQSYDDLSVSLEQVEEWLVEKVYDHDLWLFIIDITTNEPIGLGIADCDQEIKEGSLEWIQILPNYRGQNLGKALVIKLLGILSNKVKFVTVSGKVDNQTKPENLYRRCGFCGNDIWHILRKK